ncbi:uncharacterized protein ARMOST_22217 [Armillaria ostoyae]|uniref:Endonuclease/exonuclease/phosphatase domain-containing protein n=1 Tax=Armillaria ostoyae TaxID=47428 RepID=A0A284SCA3_ARMOS|nr:uncharacterized protein ARMOST_22217 [Armillaria ostoyae]
MEELQTADGGDKNNINVDLNATPTHRLMTDTTNNNSTDTMKLRLYQLNINKSLTTHSCLINQIQRDDNIILIQEPYISKQGKSRATQGWLSIYPTNHKQDPALTRAVTLINRSISTNAWSSIALDIQNAVPMSLQAPAEMIIIVNIYSDGDSMASWDTIDAMLRMYTAKQRDEWGLPLMSLDFCGNSNTKTQNEIGQLT